MDLFDALDDTAPYSEAICPGAVLLHGFARAQADALWSITQTVLATAPLRQMQTPGGHWMSVQTSSCGMAGWVSDELGYRYSAHDPLSGQRWPAIPAEFLQLARDAAAAGGFADFVPDACLINHYTPGARMSLHQDRNERDFGAPIVSLSLGVPAIFLFGGQQRSDKPRRYRLLHGDVLVWGGPSRLAFHGVAPLALGDHPLSGDARINLTFRKAL